MTKQLYEPVVCLWNIVRLGVCGTILNNQCSTVYTFCSISIFFLGLQDLPVGIWNVAASLCGNCCDFSFVWDIQRELFICNEQTKENEANRQRN